jgi:hypothetical protein
MRISLIVLLKTFRHRLWEKPQVKIYGLLGFASDFQKGELSIDYKKDLYEVW